MHAGFYPQYTALTFVALWELPLNFYVHCQLYNFLIYNEYIPYPTLYKNCLIHHTVLGPIPALEAQHKPHKTQHTSSLWLRITLIRISISTMHWIPLATQFSIHPMPVCIPQKWIRMLQHQATKPPKHNQNNPLLPDCFRDCDEPSMTSPSCDQQCGFDAPLLFLSIQSISNDLH